MRKRTVIILIFLLVLGRWVPLVQAQEKITIFAAASASDAITELARTYEKETGVQVSASFAASSILAKQIDSGAPAHVFLSANPEWMDFLRGRNRIEPASRLDLLGNSLVVVAPRGKTFPLEMKRDFDFAGAFEGRLALGDPLHVPAGIYAKKALISLGWWNPVATRVVGALDVRSVLSFVERGEVGAGIVYATDARLSRRVEIVGVFPPESHPPIAYPVAVVQGAGAGAYKFLKFLQSPSSRNVFVRYGFTIK